MIMDSSSTVFEWILGFFLLLSASGVLLARKPIHASLSFLLTLFFLAIFYLQLSAPFNAMLQILVYAGAILVMFVFVIILFQDAHQQITQFHARSSPFLIGIAALSFFLALSVYVLHFIHLPVLEDGSITFGNVQDIGRILYRDFFFPFQVASLLLLVALVGALYIAKKEST